MKLGYDTAQPEKYETYRGEPVVWMREQIDGSNYLVIEGPDGKLYSSTTEIEKLRLKPIETWAARVERSDGVFAETIGDEEYVDRFIKNWTESDYTLVAKQKITWEQQT